LTPFVKIVSGTHVPGEECASKTSACKNLGRSISQGSKYGLLKKVDLGEYDNTSRSL